MSQKWRSAWAETRRCDITVLSAGDAPGWYPASTLAASASHAPAARLGTAIPPQAANEPNLQVEMRTDGSSQHPRSDCDGLSFWLRDEMWGGWRHRWMSLFFLCVCVFPGSTEEERDKKNGGNITLTSPPSRRFLTRPHCVLLQLSHRPPPAPYQTAALAVFCCWTHIESDSDPDTHIPSHVSPPTHTHTSSGIWWVTRTTPRLYIFGSLIFPLHTVQTSHVHAAKWRHVTPFCPCEAHASTQTHGTITWKQHFIEHYKKKTVFKNNNKSPSSSPLPHPFFVPF